MGKILFIDFETRSAVDLKACGADVYARDKTTEVMAFGWAFDKEKVKVDELGKKPSNLVLDHIRSNGAVVGHNVAFEWLIWNFAWKKNFPDLPALNIEQCHCTMAMSYAMGMPGALEKAAPAAGILEEKDMKGNRVMLQLSQPREIKPNGEILFWCPIEFEDKYKRMYSYCAQDVEVERQVYHRLLPLSPSEREMWVLDHRINQRGVRVDLPAAMEAVSIVDFETKRLNEEIREVTHNAVATTGSHAQLTTWLRLNGIELEGIAKSDVSELLERIDLPSKCRRALQIRQEAAKSSTAKFLSLINRSDAQDQIMRSTLQYHGAGTGRWAGRGFQLHNLPRPRLSEFEINGVFNALRA